jgi:nicotinamidase-related amidase
MSAVQRLIPSKSLVAVIDVQERLAAAMPEERMARLVRGVGVLLEAAKLLGASVLATEQYPKGLGPTLPEIAAKLDAIGAPRIEKTVFSATGAPEFVEGVERAAPATVIVVGMEAHVCVYQTVRDLIARGLTVMVAVDAVVSRRDEDRSTGISLCERAGGVPTTVETVVFDWLERAGTDEFRALSKLLR